MRGAQPAGIYIHVPFCRRKCPYCDFYSLAYSDEAADTYTGALLRAMETQPFGEMAADTLYFGGGTPILLGPERLGRILDAARGAFSLGAEAEITLEANPAAAMAQELAALRKKGFNRISFGVQSLHDGELAALGRLHSAQEARRAILDAAAAGFENISADLMLAIPGQSEATMSASIAELASLPVNHISAYLLKVEEDTPFGRQKDALTLPDEDAAADLYLACVEGLAGQGFAQYEISNFAKDGAVSRHNLKYWQGEPYLGIGPAAHSFLVGRRFYFPRDLAAFLAAERPFTLTVDDGPGGGPEETLLLGLRLTEGVNLHDLPLPPEDRARLIKEARRLEGGGLTTVAGTRISLTPRGFLLSNSVITALLQQRE